MCQKDPCSTCPWNRKKDEYDKDNKFKPYYDIIKDSELYIEMIEKAHKDAEKSKIIFNCKPID